MRDAALSRCELQTEAASQRIAPRRLVSDAAGRDAVKRATRVFRKPSAEGYGEKLDFGDYPSEELILKLARVLDADADDLLILAKKIPESLKKRVMERPDAFRKLASLYNESLD